MKYPLSNAEVQELVRGICGPAGVEGYNAMCAVDPTVHGPWRANSLGFPASRQCDNVKMKHIPGTAYSIVFWANQAAVRDEIWEYQIIRFRPGAPFDETLDVPVNLNSEGIRVLIDTGPEGLAALRSLGVAVEGAIIYLEVNGDMKPIKFPSRPRPLPAGTLVL
ncbi:hypothetical protein C8R46DRAFT_1131159 [Mycena filopes]|nr:hypothetical protein C8R46DRAFT_1131159 [Mycena filopes]